MNRFLFSFSSKPFLYGVRLLSVGVIGMGLLLMIGLPMFGVAEAAVAHVTADCSTTPIPTFYVVDNLELDEAVTCYNETVGGSMEIILTADVYLTGTVETISNTNGTQLEISGDGHTIDGNDNGRLFYINRGDITFSAITLTHGSVGAYQYGGALLVEHLNVWDHCGEEDVACEPNLTDAPHVTLSNTLVTDNSAHYGGGGIAAEYANLTLENSEISANTVFYSYGIGGGIRAKDSSVEIRDSVVQGNNGNRNGGGIYVLGGTFELDGSTVQANTASNQAGIYVDRVDDVLIQGSQFISNTISGEGGALAFYYANNAQVIDNDFSQNGSSTGGAIYISFGDNYQIRGNRFVGNTASSSGGAYYSRYITNSTINDNVFTGNSSVKGGAMRIYTRDSYTAGQDQVTVEGNLMQGNQAENGGAVYIAYDSETYLVNNTIAENEATGLGTAIYVDSNAALFIRHSTIVSNVTTVTDTAALYLEASGVATMTNSILTDHDDDLCGVNRPADGGGNVIGDGSCHFTATTSLEDTSPLLLPLADNGGATETFALPSDSPAVDLAMTSVVGEDQRGVSRPQGSGYDSGAYELEGLPVSASLDTSTLTLTWSDANGCTADLYASDDAYSGFVLVESGLSGTQTTQAVSDDENAYYYIDVSNCAVDTVESRPVGVFNFEVE